MAIQNFKIKHGLNLGDHELIDSTGNINLPNGASIQIDGAPLDALPDQTGQIGKYLKTDGSIASWETISQPTLVSQLTNDAGYQTLAQVQTQVASLVDSAPSTLNTLNELAAALGDDPNFATTVSTQIGSKWTQNNTKISNWDTAYSWGNHASAGYLNYSTLSDGTGQGFKVGAHLSYYGFQTEGTHSGIYFNNSMGFLKANYTPILYWDQNKVTIKNSLYTDTITLNGSTGALTAVSFIGDGSQLTGVATSSALALKADLSGATFTGTVNAPTVSSKVKTAASREGIQWTDDSGTKLFGLSVYGTANTYSPSLVWNSGNPTGNFTGGSSVVIGAWAAPNGTGGSNTLLGYGTGYSLTSGIGNTFIGSSAGYSNIGTGNNNTFLGYNTSAAGANQSNQTVIGYGATGNGSNTVTIGNSSVTDTYLKGIIHGDGSGLTSLPPDATKANLSGATFTGTVKSELGVLNPTIVPIGKTLTIPSGYQMVVDQLDVQGELDVQGTLATTTGGSLSQTTMKTQVIQNPVQGNGLTINENTSIGGSSPVPAKLKVIRTAVEGSTNGHVIANLHRTGVSTISHGSGLLMTTDYANSTGVYIGGNGKGEFGVYTTQDNSVSNVQKFGISQTGAVTLPLQPAFQYSASTNQEPSTAQIIVYDTLVKNVGNSYTSSSSKFTAPVAGWYEFTWRYWFRQGATGTINCEILKNGIGVQQHRIPRPTAQGDFETIIRTVRLYLEQNDYVQPSANGGTGTCFHSSTGSYYSEWSGILLS